MTHQKHSNIFRKYHPYEGLSSLKPQLSGQLQGVQTWSCSTWKQFEQQESCTSTLAPKKPKRFVIKAYNTHQYISIQFYSIYSSNGRSIHWPKNIVIFTRAAIKHQARSEALLPKSCHFIYGWFHSSRRKLLQQILSKQNFEGTWRDHKTALPEVVLWAKLMSRTCASQNAETISLVRPAFSLQLLKITFSVTMISEQATPSPVKRH